MKRDYPEHNPDWLRAEHYAKRSKKENPHGLGCTLCEKTHTAKQCPNRKASQPEPTAYERLYQETEEQESYGW